jgi:hypothetical protein
MQEPEPEYQIGSRCDSPYSCDIKVGAIVIFPKTTFLISVLGCAATRKIQLIKGVLSASRTLLTALLSLMTISSYR